MDSRARYENFMEAVETMVEAKLAELHTAEPCAIVSVDYQKQTAVLQPTSKTLVRKPDGSTEWTAKPQIPDVKIHYPGGGGLAVTHPLNQGDEVLAVMASRSPDVWQQSGGEQQIIDARMHDLSNAFCFTGFRSDAKALPNVSPDSKQIRTEDDQTNIDFKGSQITVQCHDAKVVVTADSVTLEKGSMKVIVTGSRVDLGGEGGSPVVTLAGPSSKVFAVT